MLSDWPGGIPLHAFGRNYRTVSAENLTEFVVGIASARHAQFPAHMASIVHIQGADYINIDTFIRKNQSYAFDLSLRYDAMWLLPHHAWQGPFLAERNRIKKIRECPYVWSPRILQTRGNYSYIVGTSGNVGIYETNVGIYKTSHIPLLILNK